MKHYYNPFKRATTSMLTVLALIVISAGVAFAATASRPSLAPTDPHIFALKWGSNGSGDGQFFVPVGVAVDSSGNVYVVEQLNHRIQKFDRNGTFITKWGSLGSGNGQFAVPCWGGGGMAVTTSMWVDNGNRRIQKFDSSGNFLRMWGWNVKGGGVFEICTAAETCQAGTSGSGDGQFLFPRGVGVDSSGNVYVAETGNHRIQKFDSNGTFLTKWGSQGSGDGQFDYPTGVAVDGSGNVYVEERDNDRIQKFDSTGNFLAKWGSQGSGDGQFQNPTGMAVDSSGNVYVADRHNHRIQKFDSNGTLSHQVGQPRQRGWAV